MNERTHLDLFSGIGGFALAARANGVRTIQFCEIDPRCRAFLAKAWPGVPVQPDIDTFDSSGLEHVWLLSGGPPCQDASRAGKQAGANGLRWKWPQTVRVIAAVKPTWALLENPPGIGDVGLAGILAEVEAQGYEVRVLSIPACAVGAPHRRERFWIVANRVVGGPDHAPIPVYRKRPTEVYLQPGTSEDMWSNFVWLPCADSKVRRAPDDSFGLVDGLHRSLLGALGNSIVPQVAAQIIAAMIEAETP